MVGLSILVTAVMRRPEDEIIAGITTAVVMAAAKLSPHGAWRQPILGWRHSDRRRRGPGGRVARLACVLSVP